MAIIVNATTRRAEEFVPNLDELRRIVRVIGSLDEGSYGQALFIADQKNFILALITSADNVMREADNYANTYERDNGREISDPEVFRAEIRERDYC